MKARFQQVASYGPEENVNNLMYHACFTKSQTYLSTGLQFNYSVSHQSLATKSTFPQRKVISFFKG